jgi:hypothetical protein
MCLYQVLVLMPVRASTCVSVSKLVSLIVVDPRSVETKHHGAGWRGADEKLERSRCAGSVHRVTPAGVALP